MHLDCSFSKLHHKECNGYCYGEKIFTKFWFKEYPLLQLVECISAIIYFVVLHNACYKICSYLNISLLTFDKASKHPTEFKMK